MTAQKEWGANILTWFWHWYGTDYLGFILKHILDNSEGIRVCVGVCAEWTFPHPHSDAIVDSTVKVPFVEPAWPKHTDPSTSSSTATSPSAFGRGQRSGILEDTNPIAYRCISFPFIPLSQMINTEKDILQASFLGRLFFSGIMFRNKIPLTCNGANNPCKVYFNSFKAVIN